MKALVTSLLVSVLALSTIDTTHRDQATGTEGKQDMELGAFSISLAVADLEVSRAFYEKLGFEQVGGEAAQNWLVLRRQPDPVRSARAAPGSSLMRVTCGGRRRFRHPPTWSALNVIHPHLHRQLSMTA